MFTNVFGYENDELFTLYCSLLNIVVTFLFRETIPSFEGYKPYIESRNLE